MGKWIVTIIAGIIYYILYKNFILKGIDNNLIIFIIVIVSIAANSLIEIRKKRKGNR